MAAATTMSLMQTVTCWVTSVGPLQDFLKIGKKNNCDERKKEDKVASKEQDPDGNKFNNALQNKKQRARTE